MKKIKLPRQSRGLSIKSKQFKAQNFYFLVVVFSFSFFLFNFNEVGAAQLSLQSQTQKISAGQQFKLDLILNTENENINAIEGKITFPANLLGLKEIQDSNSAINFWIEQPKLEQAGTIGFSGIVPGGYQGIKGFIFSVVFQAKSIGSGVIQIGDAKVLLNDGEGTEANLKISPFQFSISEKIQTVQPATQLPTTTEPAELEDTEPPEEFNPEISSSTNIFDGKWFLVFTTQDKGSGIDRYEIQETKYRQPTISGWIVAENPYVLKDQELKSYIYIKAIDKAGNERMETIPPKYPSWYEITWIWIIIIKLQINKIY